MQFNDLYNYDIYNYMIRLAAKKQYFLIKLFISESQYACKKWI